jgi:hypothetical protein
MSQFNDVDLILIRDSLLKDILSLKFLLRNLSHFYVMLTSGCTTCNFFHTTPTRRTSSENTSNLISDKLSYLLKQKSYDRSTLFQVILQKNNCTFISVHPLALSQNLLLWYFRVLQSPYLYI